MNRVCTTVSRTALQWKHFPKHSQLYFFRYFSSSQTTTKPTGIKSTLKQRLTAEKKKSEKGNKQPEQVPDREGFDSGKVESVVGGVVKVSGVPNAHLGTILSFLTKKGEVLNGLVMQMKRDFVVAAVLENVGGNIAKGNPVRDDGRVASFPVGANTLGRVLDAVGEPIDGKGPLENVRLAQSLSLKTPSVVSRTPMKHRIHTGIKQIDFFHPLAKGIRTSIVSPLNCGKTDLALEIICNQRTNNLAAKTDQEKIFCVYVSIGKSSRKVEQIVKALTDRGAMEYTTVISATNVNAVPLQYLAPFGGSKLGGYYRDNGLHCLVVYDDLGTHAESYTLLHDNLGKGHMTHAHARILEEAAQLSSKKGGGSCSVLCLFTKKRNDDEGEKHVEVISSYVDNTIHLDPDLVIKSVWPPINCGKLVGLPPSRFQPPVMRDIRNRLNDLLRQSEFTANQYSWAQEFGLEPEDLDQEILEYRDKLQYIMSQKQVIKTTPGIGLRSKTGPEINAISLTDLLIVLHSAVRGGLGCLNVDDRETFLTYVDGMIAHVKEEEPELYEYLHSLRSTPDSVMTVHAQNQIDKICDDFNRKQFRYVPLPRV